MIFTYRVGKSKIPAGSDDICSGKQEQKIVGPYYALRNKVLRNIEIFDFVIFRDGS